MWWVLCCIDSWLMLMKCCLSTTLSVLSHWKVTYGQTHLPKSLSFSNRTQHLTSRELPSVTSLGGSHACLCVSTVTASDQTSNSRATSSTLGAFLYSRLIPMNLWWQTLVRLMPCLLWSRRQVLWAAVSSSIHLKGFSCQVDIRLWVWHSVVKSSATLRKTSCSRLMARQLQWKSCSGVLLLYCQFIYYANRTRSTENRK